MMCTYTFFFFFFFQAEDGIRDLTVTGVQTCALPIYMGGIPQAVLVGAEEAPQQRADTEEGEEGRRDQFTLDPLRLRAEPETETAVPIRGDGRQAARVVAEVGITRIGPDHCSEGSVSLPGRHVNSHDSIRIHHVRRRPEEQPVHDAEHRGVRPDAEPQCEHSCQREPRAPCERAQRVAEILEHARDSGLRVRESSPPDPLSLRERGNSGRPPSPERRGGQGVRTYSYLSATTASTFAARRAGT